MRKLFLTCCLLLVGGIVVAQRTSPAQTRKPSLRQATSKLIILSQDLKIADKDTAELIVQKGNAPAELTFLSNSWLQYMTGYCMQCYENGKTFEIPVEVKNNGQQTSEPAVVLFEIVFKNNGKLIPVAQILKSVPALNGGVVHTLKFNRSEVCQQVIKAFPVPYFATKGFKSMQVKLSLIEDIDLSMKE